VPPLNQYNAVGSGSVSHGGDRRKARVSDADPGQKTRGVQWATKSKVADAIAWAETRKTRDCVEAHGWTFLLTSTGVRFREIVTSFYTKTFGRPRYYIN
jgi:hypothetical protein